MSNSALSPKRNRALRWIPWVVFAICLLATFIGYWQSRRLAEQRDQNRFRLTMQELHDFIESRFDEQRQLGLAAAAFMGSSPNATEQDFDDFLSRQGWPPTNPNLGTLSYIQHVPAGQLAAFHQRALKSGVTDLEIQADGKKDCDLVLYRQPIGTSGPGAGYDVSQIPSRRAAMETARDSGLPAATGVVHLLADTSAPQAAVVAFIPVYSSVIAPPDVAARRETIQGYIGLAIRTSELLAKIPSEEANVSIYDGEIAAPEHLLFSNMEDSRSPRYDRKGTVQPFAPSWLVRYRSTTEWDDQAGRDSSEEILGAGLIFSLILLVLTSAQTRAQLEISGYAEQIERRAAAEALLSKAGALMSTSSDYESVLVAIGQAAVPSLTDYCAVDILERDGTIRLLAFFHPDPKEVEEVYRLRAAHPPSLKDDHGLGKALRTGTSELVSEIDLTKVEQYELTQEQLEFLKTRNFNSAIIVPISVRATAIGAITLLNGRDRLPFTFADLRQIEEVAERLGLAIDNLRLYQTAQKELQEKVKAEQALQTLNDELEALVNNRTRELTVAVEELEAFCYSVSHDLRTPLRSVDGFSKALLDDFGDIVGPEGVDHIGRIRAAAKRMDELITALLTLSRLTRAEISPEKLDISQMVTDITEHAVQDGSAEFVIQKGLTATADPNMLNVLLENLLSNAIKFSSKVGSPHIEVGKKDGVFFVRDNGAGFDPRYSNKLFQPFERLHTPREFPGSGIGLATVSRIVRRHGGTIWAESEPDKGATFYFTLPE